MTLVSARVTNENELRGGHKGPEPILFLDETRRLSVNGIVKNFTFRDELNQPMMLKIEGQLVFDTTIDWQNQNWKVLKAVYALDDKVRGQLVLHDPEAEGRQAFDRFEKEQQLNTYLSEIRQDGEALGKLYRRVTGNSSKGIAVSTMFITLVGLAKENVEQFRVKSGWLWEEANFDLRALLEAGVEAGIIYQEGDSYRRQDKTVIGMDLEAAIYELSRNLELRTYLKNSLAAAVQSTTPTRDRPETIVVEDASLLELLEGVGDEATQDAVNADGSDDTYKNEQQRQSQFDQQVATLMNHALIYPESNGKFYVAEQVEPFESLDGVKDFLRRNQLVFDNLLDQAR